MLLRAGANDNLRPRYRTKQNKMKDKIFAFVQSKGPVLPVEVASAVDTNSFLAKAYLSDLIEEGKVRISNEKFGAEKLYYIQGQEQRVAERLKEVANQQKTAKIYHDPAMKSQVTPELARKRQEFSAMAKKVEAEDKKVKIIPKQPVQQNPPARPLQPIQQPQQKPRLLPKMLPKFSIFRKPPPQQPEKRVIEVKPQPRYAPQQIQNIPTKPKNFVDDARNFLEAQNGKIADVLERKKKFAEFNALLPTAFGEFKVLIHIRDKKKITDSDISLLYSKSSQRNIPGLMITNGHLTRKADRFLDTVKDSVKVKVL